MHGRVLLVLALSGALALRNVLEFARDAGLQVSVDDVPAHAGRIAAAMLDVPSGRDAPARVASDDVSRSRSKAR